jgi:hypothetical protein
MKASTLLKFGILTATGIFAQVCNTNLNANFVQNSCITFLIGAGTGCDWMCNYCASQLNSSSYYFLPPVCSWSVEGPTGYQSSGCIGNPQAGVSYTCCST